MRTLFFGFLLGALLLLFPTLLSSSSAGYHAGATSLRASWATDLQAGVSPSQIAPLQAELAATETSNLLSLPAIAFNPFNAHSELASLRERTNAIYAQDLAAARASALDARATLTFALAPFTPVQTHLLREEMDSALTPADYTALAAVWSLDALLVPLDRSLASHQSSLSALLLHATSLSLTDSDATALLDATTSYFALAPVMRFATAPDLLSRFDPVTASLFSRVNAVIHARSAARLTALHAARLAAYRAALRNAWASTPPWRVRQIIVSAFSPLGSSAVSWALRVANCESHYHPNSLNSTSGAAGLFQFLPTTWAHTPWANQSPFNPVANALAAAWLFHHSGPGQWSCK